MYQAIPGISDIMYSNTQVIGIALDYVKEIGWDGWVVWV